MYQDVADNPEGEFHLFRGRQAAELFEYPAEWLDKAPEGAVSSFAGAGNPHLRSNVQAGDTVLDLGSGAGLDSIISSWRVGETGKVIGIDLNPLMCLKAQVHAAATGTEMECHEGRMEDIPLPDESVGTLRGPRGAVRFGNGGMSWYPRQCVEGRCGADQPLVPSRGQVYDHVAFTVENLDAWFARLTAEEVTILEEPHTFGGTRAFMIEDLDGLAVELVEAAAATMAGDAP